MRLLLTGSNGFVGGRIAAAAAKRGIEVIGVGRAASPATPVARYVRHDLAAPLTLDTEVDAVVHCAALASPWASPAAYQAANVNGTRHMVEWCRNHGRPHLTYISSSSVYYRSEDQIGLTEDSPIPPDREQINRYSLTKLVGERLVEAYPGTWSVLRPRAVFGPGDPVLLPRVLAAAARGRLPLLRRPGRAEVICDLTYVDTIAHYVLAAVTQRASGPYL